MALRQLKLHDTNLLTKFLPPKHRYTLLYKTPLEKAKIPRPRTREELHKRLRRVFGTRGKKPYLPISPSPNTY
jgi:hypothetical protein